MKAIILFSLITFCCYSIQGQNIKNLSFSTESEHIIHQEFVVDAGLDEVWKVFTTEEGVQTWMAPVVKIDWRRGGTIKTRYFVGGVIGEIGTVTSEIVDYIPKKRILFKDDLTYLLSYAVVQGWITDVSDEFMFELIANGGEIFNTIELEEISDNETRVMVYMTGYKLGDAWKKQFDNAISANVWTYQKLIDRFKTGPIDWQKN